MRVRKKTLSKSVELNAAYNLIYNVSNLLFSLMSSIYASRVLGPDGVGTVSFAQNIVSYFLMIAILGIPTYGMREIAKSRESQDFTNRLFSELLIVNAISTTIALIAYFCVVIPLAENKAWIFTICGVELALNYINIDWYYRGREAYGYITVRSVAVKIVSLCAMFLLVKTRDDYFKYAAIHAIGVGANNVFNIMHARKSVTFVFCGLNIKRHLRPILILFTSTLTASLYSKVDITMLGLMQGEAVVGYYTNAQKIVSCVLVLITSVTGVFLPRLSGVYGKNEEQFQKIVSVGVQYILLLAVPACIGLSLVAEDVVIGLLGESFGPSICVVQILSLLVFVIGLGDLLCYQVVICSGNEKALITSRVIAGVANVILNVIFIPKYQHNGAAVASIISELIVNLGLLKYSLSIVKLRISKRFVLSIVVASIILAFTVVFTRIPGVTGVLSALLSAIIGAFAYFFILMIGKNDVIIAIINRMKKKHSN